MMKANLLHRCSDETGEAATWLPGLDILLWVDIDNGILHQYHPKSKRVKEHTFPEMISSIIPWKGHEHEIILTMKQESSGLLSFRERDLYRLVGNALFTSAATYQRL